MYIIFAAIGNFYYVGIYHSVDLYQYIALYSIAIVNYDYWRKIKNREKNVGTRQGAPPPTTSVAAANDSPGSKS